MDREIGPLVNKVTRSHSCQMRLAENVNGVAQNVYIHPSISTRYRTKQLNISLRRILHKFISLKAFKVQLAQEMKPYDHSMRFQSAQ